MDDMIKYKLVNKEGCTIDTTMAKSFKEARKNFNGLHEGTYKIYNTEDGDWVNARLK